MSDLATRGCDGVEEDVGLIEDGSGKQAAVADRAVCDVDIREAMDSSRCLLVLGQTILD
jgi:hypothetical protein